MSAVLHTSAQATGITELKMNGSLQIKREFIRGLHLSVFRGRRITQTNIQKVKTFGYQAAQWSGELTELCTIITAKTPFPCATANI